MFTRVQALAIAERKISTDPKINGDGAREIESGWYFPFQTNGELFAGSCGVIVNKETGKVFQLGSPFPIERDLDFYDKGYQFACYGLVILEVANREKTLSVLLEIQPMVVEPQYKHGTVWRVPRNLTKTEITQHLQELPCVFPDVNLYPHLELLEETRIKGWFAFRALESPNYSR